MIRSKGMAISDGQIIKFMMENGWMANNMELVITLIVREWLGKVNGRMGRESDGLMNDYHIINIISNNDLDNHCYHWFIL